MHFFLKGRFWGTSLLASVAAACAYAQPVLGQVDTFQDGTTMFWGGGALPTNIPNGGPTGAGDMYLQVTGSGFAGSGGVPATFNETQWGGNYLAPAIKIVKLNINNFSGTNLTMRLVMHGGLGTQFTSTDGFALAGNSGWRTVYFPLRSDLMTRVAGADTYNTVYSLCTRLMFRHDSGAASGGGTPVAASVGFDNITALNGIAIAPDSLTLVSGIPFGGSVSSIATSNNDYYSILNDESTPNATVTYSAQPADIPAITWGTVRHQIETSSDRNDLTIFIELKNYVTNTFDPIGSATSSLTDTTITTNVTLSPTRYVGTAPSRVEARVKWIPFQDLEAADGWSERIDFARWELIP